MDNIETIKNNKNRYLEESLYLRKKLKNKIRGKIYITVYDDAITVTIDNDFKFEIKDIDENINCDYYTNKITAVYERYIRNKFFNQ